jgi:ubiquinone/menaquinone biosynthesis C-methylase UbiE
MNLFLKATQSAWYSHFLNPVVGAISNSTKNLKILDVGSGPGTLAQLLNEKEAQFEITGIDISKKMIEEAKKRVSHKNISFQNQKVNAPLAFADKQFDVVTFCSVLFLVEDKLKAKLIQEALRVLKPNGKIIILTPSGKKSILSSFFEVWKYNFSIYNLTFPIWKIATTRSGRKWQRQKWLEKFASKNKLNYSKSFTFNDNATIEIITINKIIYSYVTKNQ